MSPLRLSEPARRASAPGERAGAPAASRPARRRAAIVFGALCLVVALIAMVAVLYLASRAAFGGNSDDATLVLQGRSMASGNLTLSGWDLSYDAFWTSEVPFYALAVALVGVRAQLMYLVPAVIAVLVGGAAIWLALDPPLTRRRGGLGWRAAAVVVPAGFVVAVLALPSPVLSWYLLQAGWHAVTALFCLLVFAGVARSRSWRGLVLAVVFLAASLLGDLLSAVLAGLPLLVAGGVAARRCGTWRAARHVVAVLGGCALAAAARGIAALAGTYSIGSRSFLASPSQVLRNIGSIPDRLGGMLGVTNSVRGVQAVSWPWRLAHLVPLLVVVLAAAEALASLLRGLSRSSRREAKPSAGWQLDDVLVLALGADLAAYAVFATDGNISLARYLLPGVVFATVLGAHWIASLLRPGNGPLHPSALRLLSRAESPVPSLMRRAGAVVAVVIVVCCTLEFAVDSIGPPAPQEARPLASFLAAHHLDSGIGDYWSSSIVTVDSGASVAVRPVQLGSGGRLERYDKQSSAAWYRNRFQFFVSDPANPWNGVGSAAAIRTFGKPERRYEVGSYVILVWPRPVRVTS